MRRTWRQVRNKDDTFTFVEITSEKSARRVFNAPLVVGDIPDMLSPVTGEVIRGRRGLREHNRVNGVTHMQDFEQHWNAERARKDDFFTGDRLGARARREDIKKSIHKLYDGVY